MVTVQPHRPHQNNQRAQTHDLSVCRARILHFTASPTVPSTFWEPQEQGAGLERLFLSHSSSVYPGACQGVETGRAAPKLKLENETGNHSLTPPGAGLSLPPGESLREKEALRVRGVGGEGRAAWHGGPAVL